MELPSTPERTAREINGEGPVAVALNISEEPRAQKSREPMRVNAGVGASHHSTAAWRDVLAEEFVKFSSQIRSDLRLELMDFFQPANAPPPTAAHRQSLESRRLGNTLMLNWHGDISIDTPASPGHSGRDLQEVKFDDIGPSMAPTNTTHTTFSSARNKPNIQTIVTSKTFASRSPSKKPSVQTTERAFGLSQATSEEFQDIYGLSEKKLGPISKVVLSTRFELITLLVIFLNATQVGIQTNHMATNNLVQVPVAFRVLEIGFCVFFTAEIMLRLFAFGCRYFIMWGWGWNVFDLALVVVQIAEEILHSIAKPLTKTRMSSVMLRVVRVLRVVKVARVLRVMRFSEDLQLLVRCVLHSMKSFFWAFALLLLVIYVVATYFVQMVSISLQENDIPPESAKELQRWFGSLPRAVLSLFQGLTGGVDWNDLVSPLIHHISPLVGLAFFAYSAFTILALMNLVTGIFVQCAVESATNLKEEHNLKRARLMFKSLDLNGSGTIDSSETLEHLGTIEVQEYFKSVGIDEAEAKSLFEILDHNGSGVITLEEFLYGCLRMQKPTRNFDLVMALHEHKRAFDMHASMLQSLEHRIDLLLKPIDLDI